MKKTIAVMFLTFFAFSSVLFAQDKTVINSDYARRKLIGRHFLSLQWISWDWLGRAYVRNREGVYYLTGSQKGRGNDDELTIDGVITEINRDDFKFKGKITTTISHINDGEECVREGDMTFAITGRRKYWRLQEMDNPCDTATDYVDIYFRR
ncbi:MAG: hypothetical protein OEM82_04665 [Acidobacteriota bacterium]|nr:hypothetical protein [Acidobacteriota bacterium]